MGVWRFLSVRRKSICALGGLGEYLAMQRLGKNVGRYLGDTIEIEPILQDVEAAAAEHGWQSEVFYQAGDLKLFALMRAGKAQGAVPNRKVYLSAGIHGDEPAGPVAAARLIRENKWP